VAGIAQGARRPCVGNPLQWGRDGGWNTCAAEGIYSVLAPRLVEGGDPAGNIVILSACDRHVLGVEAYQAEQSLDGTYETTDTEVLVDHFSEIFGGLETEPLSMLRAG
jgi:hypothetical protein